MTTALIERRYLGFKRHQFHTMILNVIFHAWKQYLLAVGIEKKFGKAIPLSTNMERRE